MLKLVESILRTPASFKSSRTSPLPLPPASVAETDDNVLARQGRHDRCGRLPPRIATPMVAALLSGSADGEVEAGFAAVRKGKEGR